LSARAGVPATARRSTDLRRGGRTSAPRSRAAARRHGDAGGGDAHACLPLRRAAQRVPAWLRRRAAPSASPPGRRRPGRSQARDSRRDATRSAGAQGGGGRARPPPVEEGEGRWEVLASEWNPRAAAPLWFPTFADAFFDVIGRSTYPVRGISVSALERAAPGRGRDSAPPPVERHAPAGWPKAGGRRLNGVQGPAEALPMQ
jgi:hypothetical protein